MTAEYLLKICNLYLHDNIEIPQNIAGAFFQFGHPVELCSFSSEKREGCKIEGMQISQFYMYKRTIFIIWTAVFYWELKHS